MFCNIRLPGEDNGLFVFRFLLIPGKKKRKDNLIQALGPSTTMEKNIIMRKITLVFSRKFKDWHLQWGNGFHQITRQRLVGLR